MPTTRKLAVGGGRRAAPRELAAREVERAFDADLGEVGQARLGVRDA